MLGDQGPGEGEDWAAARQVAFLPPSLGGLGLFAAERVSPAAYWAAWADALPVLRQRYPEAAARLVQELEGEPAAPYLRAAAEAARQVTAEGWTSRPEWASCARGADAPAAEGELGLGNPGWQRHAVLALHTSFRERVLLPALAPAARALLHSQSGPHAGMWLAAIPSDAASTLAPDLMHVAMRRRLRLPLPLTALHCGAEGRHGCGAEVDANGDHHLACPRTGLLPRRGFVVERAWVQVAREAVGPEGRVVPQQWLSRTTAPQVHPGDRRRLDFVVYGATSNGEALCCDATLVSPLTRAGRPVPGADAVAARRRKVARYPELTRGGPQRLVVLAAEVGGRWSDECPQFLRTLLRLRVQRAPPPLRAAAAQGWARRWWSVLSVALQRAVASSALGVWTMPPLPSQSCAHNLSDDDTAPTPSLLAATQAAAYPTTRGHTVPDWNEAMCTVPRRPSQHNEPGWGPAAPSSDWRGSSRKVAASARFAVTEMMPLQRSTHAAWAELQTVTGVDTLAARAGKGGG